MRFTTFFMIIFIGSLTMWAPQTSAQEEVYRWVDENGVIHFGDRAPEQNDAERISIPQSHVISAQPSADPAAVDPTDAQDPQPSVAQQLRDERAEARQEKEANAEVTAESCTKARAVVSQLEPKPRVMVTHEDGTVTRMDDNDRLETLGKAKAFIAENCNK
jgi:hypothetical protein